MYHNRVCGVANVSTLNSYLPNASNRSPPQPVEWGRQITLDSMSIPNKLARVRRNASSPTRSLNGRDRDRVVNFLHALHRHIFQFVNRGTQN